MVSHIFERSTSPMHRRDRISMWNSRGPGAAKAWVRSSNAASTDEVVY